MAETVVNILIANQRITMRTSRSIDPNTPLADLQATLSRAAEKAIEEAVAMATGLQATVEKRAAAEQLATDG